MELALSNTDVVALIDEEDLPRILLVSKSWFYHKQRGYVLTTINRGGKQFTVMLHRVIAKTPDGMDTDHINHNKLDNRRINLRVCTHFQNMQNRSKNNKSRIPPETIRAIVHAATKTRESKSSITRRYNVSRVTVGRLLAKYANQSIGASA